MNHRRARIVKRAGYVAAHTGATLKDCPENFTRPQARLWRRAWRRARGMKPRRFRLEMTAHPRPGEIGSRAASRRPVLEGALS